jgi:hypothetical protein
MLRINLVRVSLRTGLKIGSVRAKPVIGGIAKARPPDDVNIEPLSEIGA